MNIANITEKDAEILDDIVNKTLSSTVNSDTLTPLRNNQMSDLIDIKWNDYKYYFDILKESEVVKVETHGTLTIITAINIKTQNFINQGGFTKQVKDKLQRAEMENLKEKLLIDLTLSNIEANKLNKSIAERNKKDRKCNKVQQTVNIIVGIFNAALLIINSLLIIKQMLQC